MRLLLGCDPEFIVSNGVKPKSVIGILPGTKEKPSPLELGTIQVDNVSAEIGIDPADTAADFDLRIAHVKSQVESMLAGYNLHLTEHASALFDDEELAHPDAQAFGCDPDFDAWDDGRMNLPPMHGTNLRVAGGHVHIGAENIDQIQLIKTLDLVVGIPSLHLEDLQRKMMYGKAGCFRPKPYGVEYRTPSNFWTHTSERRQWMFRAAERAVAMHKEIKIPNVIRKVINEFDLDKAAELTRKFKLEVCPS